MQAPPLLSLVLILIFSVSVSILSIRMAFSSPPKLMVPVAILAIGMLLIICLYAGIYMLVAAEGEYDVGRSFFDALYFSVMTWTTVGYGDFIPITPISKIVAGSEALMGYVFMGVFWGVLVAYIVKTARINQEKRAP